MQAHPVSQIDSIVEAGIVGGVYPGAVVVIGTRDTLLFAAGFGAMTWTDGPTPSPDSTLYDLASLTKVVATTTAAMVLVDRGLLTLGEPVAKYLPGFSGESKAHVTVRHLLEHRSGLRAFLPLNTMTENAEQARARVLTEPLRWDPGVRVVYSDLNAMLLGWVVESVTNSNLDVFADSAVFNPLGMRQTRFGVLDRDKHRAAPINLWRGHPIAGVVHDQNAERLGGVSGHAGVYSVGHDVARLARTYLAKGVLENAHPFVAPHLIEEFTTRNIAHRALGWEVNDTTSSDNAGDLFSSRAFGHTGYTGTSVWIDPANDVFVVFLTNRVMAPRHPRSITALKGIRGKLADAAVRLRAHSCRMVALSKGQSAC